MHSTFSRIVRSTLIALCLLVLGCGGGGTPTQIKPGIFRAIQDSGDFNAVHLEWENIPRPDSFRLQARLDGAGYQGGWAELPGGTTQAGVFLRDDLPELTLIWFRLTRIVNGQPLEAYEASFQRTMRAASLIGVDFDPEGGTVGLRWKPEPPSIATQFKVERKADAGPWEPIGEVTTMDPDGSYSKTDSGLLDGIRYLYRVMPFSGSITGQAVQATCTTPVFAPVDLVVTRAGSQGPVLNWVNKSRTASGVRILRKDWAAGAWGQEVVVGTVANSTSSFQDIGLVTADRLAYRVEAVKDQNLLSSSAWALWGGQNSLPELGLERGYLTLPDYPLLRDFEGAWIGAKYTWGHGPTKVQLLRTPAAPGFPLNLAFPAGSEYYTVLSLKLASSGPGSLDVAAVESVGSSFPINVQLHHARGGTWTHRAPEPRSGVLDIRGSFGGNGEFSARELKTDQTYGFLSIGPDGTLQQEDLPFASTTIVGLWPLPDRSILGLALSSAGWGTIRRVDEGNWTTEPVAGLTYSELDRLVLETSMVDLQGTLHALYSRWGLAGAEAYYLRKPFGGTAQLEVIYLDQPHNWGLVYSMAVSAEGDRVAVTKLDDVGLLQVATRGAGPGWVLKSHSLMDARVDSRLPFLMTGFRPDGRFWVLHSEVVSPGGEFPGAIFELLEEPLGAPVR